LLRKVVALLLAWALFVTFTVTAYASDIVRVDGISRQLAVSPIIDQGSQLVGMREICNMLGATIRRDDVTGEIVAQSADTELRVEIGSADVLVNGEKAVMSVSALLVDGHTMISLRFLAEAFGYSVEWDFERHEAVLNKIPVGLEETSVDLEEISEEPLHILDLDTLGGSGIVLEYDDAVEKLLKQNSTIQNISAHAIRLEERRREVYNDLIFPTIAVTSVFIEGLRGISRIDFQLMDVPLEIEFTSALAESALRSIVSSIEKAQMDMLLLDENIRLAKFNLEKNIKLRFELGLVSENAVREATRALEQLQREHDAARISLASDKEGLALVLGYRADENVSIHYRAEFVEESIDLDSLIRSIGKRPTIVIKERVYLQAKYEHDTSTATYDRFLMNERQESRLEKWNAMERARRAWEDAISDMERGIRSAYNDLKSLEENHRRLEIALDKARDAYATALVNLNAGQITRYEADKERMEILKAEIALQKNIQLVDSKRFILERPDLISSRQ